MAGLREVRSTGRAGEQAVVADAVEPARQDMEQEAADELVDGESHDLLPVGIVAAVVLVAECDPGLVEAEQPPVRDCDAMGVAREIGKYRLRPGKGWLGIDDLAVFARRGEIVEEGTPVGKRCERSEEGEPPGVV